jgi:hypothetical protein
VLLRGLPHDRDLCAAEVGAYLEASVPSLKNAVVAVTLSRDVGEHLITLRRLHAAEEAPPGDDAGGDGCCAARRNRRAEALRALRAQAARFDAREARVLGAYVTLDTVAARCAAQAALPRGGGARFAALICCAAPRRFRGKHTLTAVQSPDPANVLWENLGVRWRSRVARRVGSACALLALLAATSALAVAARTAEAGAPAEANCGASARAGSLNCTRVWPRGQPDASRLAASTARDARACSAFIQPGTGVFAAVRSDADAVGCAAAACYACFCSERGLQEWTLRRDASLRPWCDAYWRAWLLGAGYKGGAVAAALLGNAAAALLLPLLTRLERHATAAKADACEGRSIFVVSFFNSFVVTVMARGWRFALPFCLEA